MEWGNNYANVSFNLPLDVMHLLVQSTNHLMKVLQNNISGFHWKPPWETGSWIYIISREWQWNQSCLDLDRVWFLNKLKTLGWRIGGMSKTMDYWASVSVERKEALEDVVNWWWTLNDSEANGWWFMNLDVSLWLCGISVFNTKRSVLTTWWLAVRPSPWLAAPASPRPLYSIVLYTLHVH